MKTNRKLLAFFLPSLSGGGAERTMLNLAIGIKNRGFSIDLVLMQAVGPYLHEIPNTIRIIDLNAKRARTCLPALVKYLSREEPKWLMSGLHANPIALLGKLIPGISTKVIISERNTLSIQSKNTKNLRSKISPLLAKCLYPIADGIVAVSKGVANDLIDVVGISKHRVRYIYNPVVTPQLRQKADVPLSDPWFSDGQPATVLAIGSLTAQKDFSVLIEAFSRVIRTHPSRLLILGEGQERAKLEAQVRELKLNNSIKMPGFVSNPYPYMRRADVFVLSSRWEGLPGVLIEALYCEIPIVATDCPSGVKEILNGQEYGKVVPVGDVSALANGISAALRGEIKKPAVESWRRFELETIVDQYINNFFRE